MNTQKKMLAAFILNLAFSVFEFFGGIMSKSSAIMSDSLHDMGDALGIGFSLFLEAKSKKRPDGKYTFGYRRFSVLGALITNIILLFGSAVIIFEAIGRITNPVEIRSNSMLILAVIGTAVNLGAALITKDGEGLNARAVNLHMLEDVLGWISVLIGAVVIRFTNLYVIDPVLSICTAIFITIHSVKSLKQILFLFLERIPDGISAEKTKEALLSIDGVSDVRRLNICSVDTVEIRALVHVTVTKDSSTVKRDIRKVLAELDISESVIEIDNDGEVSSADEFRKQHTHKCACHHGHFH